MSNEKNYSPLEDRGFGDGEVEQRLWNYIDGFSSPEEKNSIEQLLKSNAAWKEKHQELIRVQQLLQSAELEEPSLRFTKNVMEEISRLHIAPASRNYINKKIIWGITAFFITIIVGFIGYGLGQIDWSVPGDTNLPIDFSRVDYSKMFNNNFVNGFMMVNVILGLFLLDRYLAGKRNKLHKDA